MILPNFAKNCMKLRKFRAVEGGGHAGGCPLDPLLLVDDISQDGCIQCGIFPFYRTCIIPDVVALRMLGVKH